MPYIDEVLADDPYLYWRLGEAAGSSTVADSSGNSRDGTVFNETGDGLGANSLLVNQPGNTSFECTGIGKSIPYITSANIPGIYSNNAFTIEAWIKRNETPTSSGRIFNKEYGFGFLWNSSTNGIRFNCAYNNSITQKQLNSVTTLNQDEDYHVVGVASFDGTTLYMDLYINGVLDASTTQAATSLGNADPRALVIGHRVTGPQPEDSASTSSPVDNTVVDEAALYDTALSAQRIEDHYNAGIAPPYPESGLIFPSSRVNSTIPTSGLIHWSQPKP